MGTRRRESQSNLIVRITKAIDDRDTLLPCPACGGDGLQLVESATGYRKITCSWCDSGLTDRITVRMFERWLRIKRVNCPEA